MENRAARETSKTDCAFVGCDDALDDCQAKTCSAALGGKKRMENAVLQFLWDARACVGHTDFDIFVAFGLYRLHLDE